MATVPQTIIGRIEFYEQHLPVWAADPAAIGLTAAQVADLTSRTQEARTRYEEALAIRNSAKALTQAQNDAVEFMQTLGGDLIKTIRAFAETNDDPSVYVTAEIPAPAPPSPPGPPAKPNDLDADFLLPFGIRLTWKGSTARGTYFGVWRTINGETAPTLVKTTNIKEFEDRTIPDGTTSVDYFITAYRDTFEVSSTPINIQFGAGGTTSLTLAA